MKYLLALISLFIGQMSFAQDLAQPTGDVILTVSGEITVTNGDGVAQFDRDMIDALTQHTTVTHTPWYDGPHSFSGPLLTALLEAVGAQGSTVRMIALNDYSSELPVEDSINMPLILASRLDGNVMRVRDKGPLFMIYPFDDFPETDNEIFYGRSVWQISRIEIIE